MKLWHISDTHGYHDQLTVPAGVDIVVHSGDASNWKDPYRNEPELRAFIDWFATLPIPTKVFVPGNHDTSLDKGLITRELVEHRKIHLLINEEREINGLRFWGSPFTPRYGDWAYMKDRGTINRIWDNIPEDLDVLITHGPPYGILDATYNHRNKVELVGCSALRKRVTKVQPRFMLFGHVHSCEGIRNAGTRTVSGLPTLFSNGSCCDDGRMGTVTSHGNIIEIASSQPGAA
jgi:Icc-related predicted phosphoesterase